MRNNILFIFTDQQRFDTIAALGAPIIKTPAIDSLVREGVSFDRCYTPSPVCVSARNALMTGLPPHITGCVDNKAASFVQPAFMERLSEHGYRTHGVGKMHFRPDPMDMRGLQTRDVSEPFGDDDYKHFLAEQGFDYVDEPFGVRSEYYYLPQVSQLPAKAHHSHWVADRAIDFLKQPKKEPFFLWASFIKPHPPFESPTPWNRLYRAAEMPLPHRPDGYQEQLSFWNHVQNRYKYRDAGTDDLLLRTTRAAYYSSISFVDYNIGRILEALGDEINNTLVVFTSDHGEMLGDFGAFGKRCMLEASVRIPLVMRWPDGRGRGERISSAVSLVDMHPTFMSVAGCKDHSQHPESIDLSGLTHDTDRPYVFSQFSSDEWGQYMITDGRWKYCYSAADEKEWLYDLNSNENEAVNLMDDGQFRNQADQLKECLISRFYQDGYEAAVENGTWKKYGISRITDERDFGLLFQDPAGLQKKVNGLGEYSRPIRPQGMGKNILSNVQRSRSNID